MSPRQYRSSLRDAQAEQTKVAIIEAAMSLFLENGYSETSIREIAEKAGVAERTVYVAFKDKPTLLNSIAEHFLYGETEEGKGEAGFLEGLRSIEDPEERLRVAIQQTVAAWEQGLAAIGRIVGAAATTDSRLQDFVASIMNRRNRVMWTYTETIIGHTLPRDARHQKMIDELEALTSEEVYWILRNERQWPRAQYEQYVFDLFTITLNRYGIELPLTDTK